MSFENSHFAKIMKYAIKIAKRSNPFPNPKVGCIIVNENYEIISEAFHEKVGKEHAEILAINIALKKGYDLSKCTLITTLEPCTYFPGKKTDSCTSAIINSGIKRVVIGCTDPNPFVSGLEELQKHGIEVILGIEEQKAKELIKEHNVYIKEKRPFIALKAGVSIDGKLATDQGVSKWINSEKMREYSNSLRGKFDCILVGINTLLSDNPLLTQRFGKIIKQPNVIVVDSNLKIPLDSNIFKEKNRKFFIITDIYNKDNSKLQDKIKELEKMGVNIIYVNYDDVEKEKKLLNLKKAFEILASQYFISSIAVEGGATIHSYLIEKKLFDEIYLYIGAKIIGGNKYNICNSVLCNDAISKCINLKLKRIKRIENDVLLHYEKIN